MEINLLLRCTPLNEQVLGIVFDYSPFDYINEMFARCMKHSSLIVDDPLGYRLEIELAPQQYFRKPSEYMVSVAMRPMGTSVWFIEKADIAHRISEHKLFQDQALPSYDVEKLVRLYNLLLDQFETHFI